MSKQGIRGGRALFVAGCVALGLAWTAGPARASKYSQTCDRVQSDVVEIDGMVDDWHDVNRKQVGGSNSNLSYDLRCAYDDKKLYVMVNVRDQVVVRRPSARLPGEDGVRMVIRSSKGARPISLDLFPGMGKVKPVRKLGRGRLPKWIEVEDSLQKRGYSIEVAIPLRRIPGWGPNTAAFPSNISVYDADRSGRKRTVLGLDVALRTSDGVAVYKSFLRSARLRPRDIRVDRMANMDGAAGSERLVAGGSAIGILGRRFAFMRLPVQASTDVLVVKPVDLFGTGHNVILAHYVQRGNGGSREVVGIWKFDTSGSFSRVLAFEVKKESGANVLPNTWKLVRAGKLRKKRARGVRGFDILVEAGKPTGWDEDSYEETPAKDVKPILLPWEDKTRTLYVFDGGQVGEAAPKNKR